jgi:glycosyltransferase involved in cell wall biosynthesis
MTVPHLTTLHGRLDLDDLGPVYDEFGDIPVVSISDAQRRPLPQAGWLSTVYHGLPAGLLQFNAEPEGYFAFVGRISPEKRVDRAIEIATTLNVPLKIAAKVDKVDMEYFKTKIEPMLDHDLVEFVGEIGEAEKSAFMGGARALLFPIDWPEPFGLVMIEAMACGTPVVAFRNGSVDEVLEEGVTGFIVESMEAAIDSAKRVGELDRRRVRAEFDRRFTAERMAKDYLELYAELAARKTLRSGLTGSSPPPADTADAESPSSSEVVAA